MMEKIEKIQHIEGDAEPSSWENEDFTGFSPHLSPADDVMTQLEREDGSKA